MKRTLSTLDLRRKLGEVLDRVALRHDRFVISRKGKPLAALVPIDTLEQLEHAARMHLLEVLDRPQKTAVWQREADALADEAKHATRARHRR